MATTAASCTVSLLSPNPRAHKGQENQVNTRTVQGNVNCRAEERTRSRASGLNSSSAAIVRRRGPHRDSPSTLVLSRSQLKATARTGAEASEDSTEGDDEEDDATIEQALLHRRQLLWGATGTFSYLTSAGFGVAAPVPPADLSLKYCKPVPNVNRKTNSTNNTVHCCLPDLHETPIDFKFEYDDLHDMRIRKPAHILSKDPAYVAKYNLAYLRMKQLPDDDPRSFAAQWHIHCAFCMGAYLEPESGIDPGFSYPPPPPPSVRVQLQYHYSWAFAPWHRMYLYFHERILGDLIGDKSFALPVWNWDNQREEVGGNQMPLMYAPTGPIYLIKPLIMPANEIPYELSNAIRNREHFPPEVVRLDPSDLYKKDLNCVFQNNLAFMNRAMVSPVSITLFLGKPYRAGQTTEPKGPGSIETNGHNIVHS
ncbi:protein MpPPO70 [Marchantia polymorpha subsp. ruderalis]